MLKLLIVDDERLPRECLATQIAWPDYGVEVVGTAGSGLEALEILERAVPDVVVTDIRMPGMDGLELLKRLRAQWPGVEAIVMSGYEEFDYAKRAMALGVKHYLLKPLDPAELLAAVLEVGSVQAEQAEGAAEEYLRYMLYGCYTPERGEGAMRRFAPLNGRFFCVLALQFDNLRRAFEGHPRSPYNRLREVARRCAAREAEVYFVDASPHNMMLVVAASDKERAQERSDALAETLAERLCACSFRDYAIGLSGIRRGVDKLCDLCQDALRAANMKYLYGNAKVFRFGERPEMDALSGGALERVNRIVESTVRYDPQELAEQMEMQYRELRRSNACQQEMQSFARTVIGALMERLAETGFRLEDIYADPAGLLLSICALDGAREIVDRVNDLMRAVGLFLRNSGNSSPEQICMSAKRYIERNYADVDLSTKAIAENLHFSTAYLSSLFSAFCRTTITNYINTVRVENAKAMLKAGDAKVNSIARMVGYEHNSYFCTVFKRVVGCSPSEYRASLSTGGRA